MTQFVPVAYTQSIQLNCCSYSRPTDIFVSICILSHSIVHYNQHCIDICPCSDMTWWRCSALGSRVEFGATVVLHILSCHSIPYRFSKAASFYRFIPLGTLLNLVNQIAETPDVSCRLDIRLSTVKTQFLSS